MTLHAASVYAWCAVTAWSAWCDAVPLIVAWYSGVEPELSRRTKIVLCARIVVAVALAAVAVATL